MARNKVDLRRLPAWLQYAIAITVVAVVVIAAWIIGRDRPVPAWISKYLVPILGWSYIVLFAIAIWYRYFRKKRQADRK